MPGIQDAILHSDPTTVEPDFLKQILCELGLDKFGASNPDFPPRKPGPKLDFSNIKYASDLPALSLDDFIAAIDKLPQQDYLITPILPTGRIMLFVGSPWAGKSFDVQNLCLQMANGGTWHGLQVKKSVPLYLTWEGAAKGIQSRFSQMLNHTKQKSHPFIKMLSAPMFLNTFEGKQKFMDLIQSIQRQTGISVVILDSFPYTCKGRYQDDEVVNSWWNSIQEISKTFGLSFVVVWEFTKPIIFKGEEVNPYDLSRLKGAYGVAYKADTVLAIGDLSSVEWEPQKNKTVRKTRKKLVMMKSKDLPRFPSLTIELDPGSNFFVGEKWALVNGVWTAVKSVPSSKIIPPMDVDYPPPDYDLDEYEEALTNSEGCNE